MTLQETLHGAHGPWTTAYLYAGIVLFGAAMFGLGASSGTALFHVPALWNDSAKLQHVETVVIPKIKGDAHWQATHQLDNDTPSAATPSKDCPR